MKKNSSRNAYYGAFCGYIVKEIDNQNHFMKLDNSFINIKGKHSVMYVTGESNGNPLQYSCLEKSRDGGAW